MVGSKRNNVSPPGDPRPAGEITFNYSSHDGRFWLGAEPWFFETRWSSAGSRSVHLYNDAPSIRGIAIAEGIAAIGHVNAEVIGRSDFTRRDRTPTIGQCAVLENQNGHFAVLQILSVGYSDLPSENMLKLRYAIQTDRAADFSGHDAATDGQNSMARLLLHAAEEARMALAVVRGSDEQPSRIPFGHNGPPPEYALSEVERQEAVAAVEAVATEVAQPAPDLSRLRVAARTIAHAARSVGRWISGKIDTALDEFARTIGKAVAIASVGAFAAWVALHGKLSLLTQLLAGFAG